MRYLLYDARLRASYIPNQQSHMPTPHTTLFAILTFIAGALLLISIGELISLLRRPKHFYKAQLQTYESGEAPMDSAWKKFNARFYTVALIFLLFEVETVLLWPWATVWADPILNKVSAGFWSKYTALSALLFIILLAIGFAYIWRQGYFKAMRPPLSPTSFATKIPRAYYEQVNKRYASTTSKTSGTCIHKKQV